jgi:hypothetical protein
VQDPKGEKIFTAQESNHSIHKNGIIGAAAPPKKEEQEKEGLMKKIVDLEKRLTLLGVMLSALWALHVCSVIKGVYTGKRACN